MGVWTRTQLLADGGPKSIARRVESGELVRLLPSVYSTPNASYLDLCTAVSLWKPRAALSHDTAAWLWGLIDDEPTHVHATLPSNTKAPDWVRLHRRPLSKVLIQRGFRVVSKERCILDIATTMSTADIERVVDCGAFDLNSLRRQSDEWSGRHGVTNVRKQIDTQCRNTRSEPERMVARALTVRRLRLVINGRVGNYIVDLVDYWARVAVEIDGREFHSSPEVFTNDRVRQNILALDGWLVIRFSAARVNAHLDDVADEIIEVVRTRRRGRKRRTP